MTLPRRRLLRPAPPASASAPPAPAPDRTAKLAKLAKLREKLHKDRRDLARWMARLKRAFHFVQKHQGRITRLERQIAQLEGE